MDIFGFEKAIQLDHLTLEQLKEVEKILDKLAQRCIIMQKRTCPVDNSGYFGLVEETKLTYA